MRAVIVGAGLLGLSAARELRRRGLDVVVVDPGVVPRAEAATTDVSKVVRLDYGADELWTRLAEEALDAWPAFDQELGAGLFHGDGFLVLSGAPLRPGTFEGDSFDFLGARGHPLVRLDANGITELCPALAPGRFVDGYLNPRGGWAERGEVLAALARLARAEGVGLREGEAAHALLERGGKVRGVTTREGAVEGDLVLVAAGAWAPKLLPSLAALVRVTAQPVLLFRPADPAPFSHPRFRVFAADIARTGYYGFPALPDGTVKIANHGPGFAVDPDGPRAVPPDVEPRFRAFLRDAIPGLAEAPLAGSRLCLYADSADGDLVLARDPERPGLAIASGDSGHAFKFAPLLGRLAADAALGVDAPWTKRFGLRSPASAAADRARFSGE